MPLSFPLLGVLLLVSLATAAASIVTAALMLKNPPVPPSRLSALLALLFASSATAVYCYGWMAVALGGPFPELCGERNASGAELGGVVQEYWPPRSACVYSDGTTVEHVSPSINVLLTLLAGLAVVLACAGALLARRSSPAPEGSLGTSH
ncbi:hypothetical protein ABT026_06825 [Streptomyces sp. NPDC002734]|uniref:hypothetical protein n=1 Tax=Streptomyces sp. NPDC002734 TaxID=3154426 RepID=UPI00331917E5